MSNCDGKHVTRAKDRRETDCGGGQRGAKVASCETSVAKAQCKSRVVEALCTHVCKLGAAYTGCARLGFTPVKTWELRQGRVCNKWEDADAVPLTQVSL